MSPTPDPTNSLSPQPSNQDQKKQKPPDLKALAEQVYRLMKAEIRVELERRGGRPR